MARVLPGVQAQNVRASLKRLDRFLNSLGKIPPSQDDMEILGWVKQIMSEVDADG